MHLSSIQLKVVTDILVSAGEVFFAVMVVPFFTATFNFPAFIIGIMFTGGAWIMAITINRHNTSL